jgi:hypothetical protein
MTKVGDQDAFMSIYHKRCMPDSSRQHRANVHAGRSDDQCPVGSISQVYAHGSVVSLAVHQFVSSLWLESMLSQPANSAAESTEELPDLNSNSNGDHRREELGAAPCLIDDRRLFCDNVASVPDTRPSIIRESPRAPRATKGINMTRTSTALALGVPDTGPRLEVVRCSIEPGVNTLRSKPLLWPPSADQGSADISCKSHRRPRCIVHLPIIVQ